ncbi:hypothetical protein KAU34_10795 [candidate division WOR-3 bacterium]|nr:hypothetical protein [candidate division WOR-3 bacterium]
MSEMRTEQMGTSNKTLVAYASKGGVTEESANVIADILRDKHSFEVDLVNLREESSPDFTPYKNIFIGSGIRMSRWYKVALRFLENNFEDKNIVIFLSSCRAGDPKTRDEAVVTYIDGVLEKFPHIKPIATEAFGGRMRVFRKTVTDNWDKEKVKAWAEGIGKKLSR